MLHLKFKLKIYQQTKKLMKFIFQIDMQSYNLMAF